MDEGGLLAGLALILGLGRRELLNATGQRGELAFGRTAEQGNQVQKIQFD